MRRSTRNKVENRKYTQYDFVNYCVYVNCCDAKVPNTFEEAIASKEVNEWRKAMDKEMNSIKKNETWGLVNKPKDKKVIDIKWIYKKNSKDL